MNEDMKWEDMSHAQHVEYVVDQIIRHGTAERVETTFAHLTPLSAEEIEDLVDEATMKLVSGAPAEIRASITTVISYHRWNAIYKSASSAADRIAAQKQLDRLMGSIH